MLQQRPSAVKTKQNMNSDHIPSLSKLANAIPCGSEGIRVLVIAPKLSMVWPLLPSHLHLPPLSRVSILSSHTSHQTTPPTHEAHFHCRVLTLAILSWHPLKTWAPFSCFHSLLSSTYCNSHGIQLLLIIAGGDVP